MLFYEFFGHLPSKKSLILSYLTSTPLIQDSKLFFSETFSFCEMLMITILAQLRYFRITNVGGDDVSDK